MEGMELDSSSPGLEPARPKTLTVIGLLAGTALIFSYLIAYAMTNALISAEVISRFPAGDDPRLRNFGISFIVLIGAFLGIAALGRFSTRRQMQRLDALEQDAEAPLTP
jgi:hypothetical protein